MLACASLAACAEAGTTEGGDCVSHYGAVVSAPTWNALKDAMLKDGDWGDVAALRTQERGHDIGVGAENVVRVVDLLDLKGRRLVQVEVWRNDVGVWRAGAWSQCID